MTVVIQRLDRGLKIVSSLCVFQTPWSIRSTNKLLDCSHIIKNTCTRHSCQTFSTERIMGVTKHLVETQKSMPNSHQPVFEVSLEAGQDKRNRFGGFCTGLTTANQTSMKTDTPAEFTPIYRFPFIVHARLVSRFKVYHTAFTFTLIPIALYLNYAGIISLQSVYMSVGFFTVAGIMLIIVSSFIRKIVGTLYINENRDTVKLSHLTFWSHRKDEFYNISDIVPLTDTNENLSDLYVKLRTFKGESYYLTMKYGQVLKQQELMDVIGKIL